MLADPALTEQQAEVTACEHLSDTWVEERPARPRVVPVCQPTSEVPIPAAKRPE